VMARSNQVEPGMTSCIVSFSASGHCSGVDCRDTR
jgi:hypothetical protein